MDFICNNISSDSQGQLLFAGQKTTDLAKKYSTPLFLMDEDKIREKCRTYISAAQAAFPNGYRIMYASKAASFKRIYEIMAEENMCIDVVSCGEIFTAKRAGFPLENAYFHSNNKTDEDINFAMDNGVGCFVVDNLEELYAVDKIASDRKITQNIFIRITPGIDPHTFEAVSTGKVDSKFGFPIVTGQAEEVISKALNCKNVSLIGLHCHVGSQVFDSTVFLDTVDVMLDFICAMQNKYNFTVAQLDIGGGIGVRYLPSDQEADIEKIILQIGEFAQNKANSLGMTLPSICLEPGRSIVADAGMTLYTVGNVKKIPEFINYVSVDGGMSDNIRYALYGSPYTLLPATRLNEDFDMTCTVVGRCCESGDILQENVKLPSTMCRGDILACLTTGAYNHSMSSNYNKIPRPPIVMLSNGNSYVAVKRETYSDLTSLDV